MAIIMRCYFGVVAVNASLVRPVFPIIFWMYEEVLRLGGRKAPSSEPGKRGKTSTYYAHERSCMGLDP